MMKSIRSHTCLHEKINTSSLPRLTLAVTQLQDHHRSLSPPSSPSSSTSLGSLNPPSNEEILISLVKSSTQRCHLLQIHAYLLRTCLLRNHLVCSAFLSRLSLPPFQDLSYARRVFDKLPRRNVSSYNTMIRAYAMGNLAKQGLELYREMLSLGICPVSSSLSFVIKCIVKIGCLFGGMQVHAQALRDGHQSDSLLLTGLMDFYSSRKKYGDACKVFDEIPVKDTVAWNTLITCYMKNHRRRDALGVFDMMQSSNGCQPDDVTCLLVLQACAQLNTLEFGERVHRYIVEHAYGDAMNVSNMLITMYSRCGCVEKAYEVFRNMPRKDVVSWSAMVSGLASNGYGRDAIEAFKQMQRAGVAPDDQTFTGVLSACSHSGLLDEGRMLFDRMSREFRILPNVHHYGCMVDLMGRAGLLEEAYEFVESMRVKPDATIWRTLLGACRIHRNPTLGERVVEHLIELKAQEAGDYVLLLNMYSSVADWEKVVNLRKLMKENGIHTTPACSTIEMKGEIHEFIADDVSHPRMTEIYEMLDEINRQLKIAGYVAEITSELHNTAVEEKRFTLSYHSEKLAIAFGVLSTPPGTTIRVAKDLRICVDCHNFAKILSGVYNRAVVIRDRTRFHHFRGGRCSCNDYW
nr:pentatricopeptide repeat-containing protein At3g47530 [Ipomoea batatas]